MTKAEWERQYKELELKYQAARNLLSQAGHVCHVPNCLCKVMADQEISAELQRLKGLEK